MADQHIQKPTVADHVADFIRQRGQEKAFLFPGGTIAPLMEGLANKGVELICTRHEQGAGYAALARAKLSGRAEAVLVSSGPGVTNIVTAVADAYCDSVPLVIFTGQVGVQDMRKHKKHRQLGFQEIDTAGLFQAIAKQVFVIKNPRDAVAMTDMAFRIAEKGRQGPVVVDFPMSSQLAMMDKVSTIPNLTPPASTATEQGINRFLESMHKEFMAAKRPVMIVGNGVWLGDAVGELRKLARLTQMPYSQSLPALGILPSRIGLSTHSLGFHGHTGNQAAGLALQQADFGLILGSRLDVRQTGTEVNAFMKEAKLFRIEIDPLEVKYRRIRHGMVLNTDMKPVLQQWLERLEQAELPNFGDWHRELTLLKRRHALPMGKAGRLTAQRIIHQMDELTKDQSVTVTTGVGSHQQWVARHFSFDYPERCWLTSGGLGAMGYDLPAAIGAAFEQPNRRILCFVGDGSLQMNIQELATIAEYQLPITVICLDNRRFAIVSQFQKTKWPRDLACHDKKNPDFSAIAKGYGIRSMKIDTLEAMEETLKASISEATPCFVHCLIDEKEDLSPMLLAGQTLEAMEQ